ncbi:amino acid adenylation domain-containing protein [Streptomyces sp. NBC_01210]|uniref:amino acid adenylation domain-containing protein n=1 Tax=Streptomyces sp. NBC_01210 TaxID=2903774 RepID=UPI002E1671FC|nr:amino acid adenylation domain-containing protein [Streptomyces sp. NBC_01210]
MPVECLHTIFSERVRAAPDRIALSTPEGPVSYGELAARSDRLAGRLAGLGVRPGVLVGLCERRGAEAIVAMLGILKAGGAYVPIDPGYPVARIDYLLTDSGVPIVVAAADTAEVLRGRHPAIVWVDGTEASAQPTSAVPVPEGERSEPSGSDLAYVIYTSGSTGAPKGVTVEHRNVVRLFEQTRSWFHFDHRDTWSLFHSISFDFSVWEIWGALLHGGRLVLLPETVSRSPEYLVSLLRAERVTVLNQTPSAFHQLLSVLFSLRSGAPGTEGLSLRLIIFGGERLDPRMLGPWLSRHGDRTPELVNMYGITETTVHCTYRRITAADVAHGDGTSPIGVPLPDLRLYVLDEHGKPLPDGEPGEMHVAGAGLARGYLNRPQLTAERFVPAMAGMDEERLYRTGDRAVRLADDLFYLGRTDDQLKIRGYRIEPGEIEECLARLPDVARAVAAPRDFGDGDVRLVAYLLPVRPVDPDRREASRLIAAAEQHARNELPRHLRPSRYEVVPEFPMTLQGKVNRNALGK